MTETLTLYQSKQKNKWKVFDICQAMMMIIINKESIFNQTMTQWILFSQSRLWPYHWPSFWVIRLDLWHFDLDDDPPILLPFCSSAQLLLTVSLHYLLLILRPNWVLLKVLIQLLLILRFSGRFLQTDHFASEELCAVWWPVLWFIHSLCPFDLTQSWYFWPFTPILHWFSSVIGKNVLWAVVFVAIIDLPYRRP